jgi:hypothetical protein
MENKIIMKRWVASLLLGATGLLTSNLYASWDRLGSIERQAMEKVRQKIRQEQLQNQENIKHNLLTMAGNELAASLMQDWNNFSRKNGLSVAEFIDKIPSNKQLAFIKYHNDDGNTVLHMAVSKEDVDAVEKIRDIYEDDNENLLEIKNCEGQTPLALATENYDKLASKIYEKTPLALATENYDKFAGKTYEKIKGVGYREVLLPPYQERLLSGLRTIINILQEAEAKAAARSVEDIVTS